LSVPTGSMRAPLAFFFPAYRLAAADGSLDGDARVNGARVVAFATGADGNMIPTLAVLLTPTPVLLLFDEDDDDEVDRTVDDGAVDTVWDDDKDEDALVDLLVCGNDDVECDDDNVR
jgi:hypothetical protein